MKRQKRILAGAAAMLLALGMLIGCDTPANSGSSDGGNVGGDIQNPDDSDGDEDNSDGGSVGGDITLPAGDPEAESELVGTWIIKDVSDGLFGMVLNGNGTSKGGMCNEDGTLGDDALEGIWSATKTDFSSLGKQTNINKPVSVDLMDEDKLYINDYGLFERTSGFAGSIEGTWKMYYNFANLETTAQCVISKESFEISSIQNYSSSKTEDKATGSRESDMLTLKEVVRMSTSPYTLSEDGNTLILNPDTEFSSTYTRQ